MQRKAIRALVAVFGFSFAGCVQSVTLPLAVGPSAPLRDRMAQYRDFAPRRVSVTLYRDGLGETTVDSQLHLANDTIVYDSADLLPLVARTSMTAQHIASARRSTRVGCGLLGGGLAAVGLGTLAFFGGASLPWSITALAVSTGLLAFTAIAMLVAGPIMLVIAAASSRDAMLVFDDDFRSNLGLCEGPSGVQDCLRGSQVPRPTPEPAPSEVRLDATNGRMPFFRLRF
ncbi:MAG: hypothetical protein Q8Q09_10870 [Deltaproteobacteria bacterium]|nr:hypothetical protein [Deltaproteobacteria bacterium]